MSYTKGDKIRNSRFNTLNIQHCKYCGKECHNLNSLKQHECRCKLNPVKRINDNGQHLADYVRTHIKGKTKYNCEQLAKQSKRMLDKYANGYVSPIKGRKVIFDYIYEEHNQTEINKWLNYLKTHTFNIPEYKSFFGAEGYKFVSRSYIKTGNTVKLTFEQNFIANILLNNKLSDENTVHHIDKNRANNDIFNLMVFQTNDEHKRFHNSKYSFLTYNEDTHLFNCIKKTK